MILFITHALNNFTPKQSHFKLQKPLPPMATHAKINRPTEEEETLNELKQKTYQSGVGTMLYLVKHSRPDLENILRDLAKIWIRQPKRI